MSEHLRLGIIGCGDIAKFTALFARLNRRIHMTACCDTDTERVRTFAGRYKIPNIYIDYQELVNKEELDAVYLAVPHHLHYPMMHTAITAGLAIFVEKPITRTLEEGIEIVKQARENQIRIGVNYQYRYDSGCYALARAVQSGALGEIYYARCNIPWHRDRSYFDSANWHRSLAASGGGTLLTQGSHMLDIILWAMGGKPNKAFGVSTQARFHTVEVEDLAMGTVELDNGSLVQVTSSMVANPERALSIELYGEHGSAIYTDKPLPRVRILGTRVKKERPPIWGVHALQRSLEGFRRWVVEDVPYLTPGEKALPVLAAVEGIYRSAHTGIKEKIYDQF